METTVNKCPLCGHTLNEHITPARALRDGKRVLKCEACGYEETETIPMTKKLKLLCIGNSFTVDPCWHLWGICHDAGIEDLVIATLHIGSCTYRMHWNNIQSGAPAYEYYKATSHEMTKTKEFTAEAAFSDEDWDAFVFHQSGLRARTNDPTLTTVESTMTELPLIMDYVEKRFPNALRFFQMPWAYQADCTQFEYVKFYGGDQKRNFDSCVSISRDIIAPKNIFDDIIPVGVAAHNLRTSYFGDNITRDGFHLNYGFGRYMASLTWYAVLTGGSIENITWVPEKYPEVTEHLPVIKECVKNALEHPYEVTESKYI